MSTEQTGKAPKEPVKITISAVQKDLSDGVDRKGIKEKYGLSNADLRNLFQHPKLKGLKVKNPETKKPSFELIDDVPEKPIKAKKPVSDEVKSEVDALESERERVIETAPTEVVAEADAAPVHTPDAEVPVATPLPENVVTQAPAAPKDEPVKVIPKSEW